VAQSFAEILLLQYAQEFRGDEFGFGKADKEKMLDVLRLHTAVFDKVQRAKYVAGRQGANLLYHIVYALKNGRDPGSPGGPYKLVAYVGHDTNIANLAGLLDLHWQLPEYPQDDMPPGGALVFELRHQPAVPLFPTTGRAGHCQSRLAGQSRGRASSAGQLPRLLA
jgi:4-phytase/acid phosphatase